MSLHDFMLILHLILFVYWLGGDIGVFYSSRFVVNPELSSETRMTAAKIMLNLDLVPRMCLSLMLTVGSVLVTMKGIEPYSPLFEFGVILLGPAWLTMVLLIHFKEGTDFAHKLTKFDFWFRWAMVIAIIASTIYSISIGRLSEAPWISAKLLIFAGLILCGIVIRIGLRPWGAVFAKIHAGTQTDEDNQILINSLNKVRPFVILIWIGVLLSAVIGVIQPGSTLPGCCGSS